MSSHHIVRDEQEPALLILNDHIDAELVGNLLEWSPTVIIDAKNASSLASHTFKIDVVIGTEDELAESKEKLAHMEPVKYLSKTEKDQTLLQTLYFLTAANYQAVNIIGKFDIKFTELLEPFLAKVTVVFYDTGIKWYRINDSTFNKWLPKGQKIKFLEGSIPTSHNNIEKKDNEWLVLNDGTVNLEFSEKGVWLGEAI